MRLVAVQEGQTICSGSLIRINPIIKQLPFYSINNEIEREKNPVKTFGAGTLVPPNMGLKSQLQGKLDLI